MNQKPALGMKKKSAIKSLLPFLPLLAVYILIICVFASDELIGDANRYIRYAKNLAHGFYTDSSNPNLSNGPGYPIVLLPFVAGNFNLFLPKLLNGIFVFIGVIYFYKTIRRYTKQKYALIFGFIIGLYPPLLRWMIYLYSESFAFMLMCGFLFHFCYLFHGKKYNRKNGIIASIYLGFLVITKVVFFQVMLTSAIILTIMFIAKRKQNVKWSLLVLIGAAIFISPYIVYAYSVTGKFFYLGTRGGEILYHRSTPFENELGNWFSTDNILGQKGDSGKTDSPYQNLSELSENHRDFYLQLQPLSNMERDSAFKTKALANIKEHPFKYAKNTIANTGRLLFNYPISYRSQNLNAYGYIIPNMFIVVLFILIIYPAYLARKRIPFELKALLIFALIYGGGMILLGSKGRYFVIMVPSLILFFAFVYTNIIKITFAKPTVE